MTFNMPGFVESDDPNDFFGGITFADIAASGGNPDFPTGQLPPPFDSVSPVNSGADPFSDADMGAFMQQYGFGQMGQPTLGDNTGTGGTDGGTGTPSGAYVALARGLFPTMPEEFIRAFAEQYVIYADLPNGTTLALATLRQDSRYDTWFPGNLRADGTTHISEGQYWDQRALHRQSVNMAGLDPDIFSEEQYISLITGDVSVGEFTNRVRTQSNDILARSEQFQSYYAELYGFVPSDTAILQSVFTGNNDALVRQSGQATVGFEGELRGFDVGLQLASSLYNANVKTQGQAQELFGQAAADVPLFGTLAQRHFDPDDDFDLGEFVQAAVFDDQEQLRRMQRLVGQERSLFSRSTTLRERNGQVVGLTAE